MPLERDSLVPRQTVHARYGLLADGWARNVRLSFGATIETIETGCAPQPGDHLLVHLLPGMSNVHSHAFQRAMAGLAEHRSGAAQDSFWSWREVMYRFALQLDPDQVQAIARMAYAEMLESGFTRVGEFHYLHHAASGEAYANPAEMAVGIIAAAESTGINLTLLPVFYAHSTFGAPPAAEQRRFIHGLDAFAALLSLCRTALSRPNDRLGVAPHSLRAVSGEELRLLQELSPAGPMHIHVAEQVKEVKDCVAALGARPVRWLLDNAPVDDRWCLVHATHMDAGERDALARSGAVVGICPITEANLGDGVFPARLYKEAGGRLAVGSDSNIEISAAAELRLLEYAQRLDARQRNVLNAGAGSTGRSLYDLTLAGGAQALDAPAAALATGAPADLVGFGDSLDSPVAPLVAELAEDRFLDRWMFGATEAPGKVWAAGRLVVDEGRHVDGAAIRADFQKVMSRLLA